MAQIDKHYKDLCRNVLNNGFRYNDKSRGDISMLQIPHYLFQYDMKHGFPIITTKRIYWKTVIHELIWMMSGATDIEYLQNQNISIWNKDAEFYSGGTEVGRIYGAQWRSWRGLNPGYATLLEHTVDQIQELLKGLRQDFYNRRHIVTAWNPAELDYMALPPCHWAFEILPTKKGFALKWHQRSVDTFLGLPFDIITYATIGRIIEKLISRPFETLIGDLSNVHFYQPHVGLVRMQLGRTPDKSPVYLSINPSISFDNMDIKDFQVVNYKPHDAIPAKLYTKVK